ncbi:spore germination protein KC [Paenibacillus sp. 1_12]|uniref:Ger(x)C family spore germination protein n=1 Tax=Paenibacillus sp. 1_12 TaxID=1566278 RepID=UPI0008E191D8|nr:Ger(x)C family spore germination protein [Paenibacillus sp. 1_12]SFL53572.1 spore germination protein KC [Paenibacillus sp. 1_12]
MMNKSKLRLSMMILLLTLLLGGCWDIKYLDDLSIVIAMGLDKGEGEDIAVTVQIVNSSEMTSGGNKSNGSGASTTVTYRETGRTILEATRKIINKNSRKLYFAHNQVLVIGEELARKGINQLFEYIDRSPEIRTDFFLLIAKGAKAEDVLSINTPIAKIPGIKINQNVSNVEKSLGVSYKVSIRDAIEMIGSGKKEVVAGSIEIIGDKNEGNSKENVSKIKINNYLLLSNMAVFKDEKLIHFFEPSESRGNSWIQNKIKNTVINIPCEQAGKVTIEIIHSKTSVKAKVQQGKPSIEIRVKQEANIGENFCENFDVSTKEAFIEVIQKTNDQTKLEMLAAIKKAKKWKTDIFGFADYVYKANPNYWKQNKSNWEDIFSQLPVEIEVITNIKREGIRNKSYFN